MVEPNEQTNKSDDTGAKDDKALAPDGKPLSDYDKALALVIRREEATKAENEVLERKEKLAANAMMGGDTGGHIEAKPAAEETPKDYNARIEKELSEGKHAE